MELLRITAMLMIISYHIFYHCIYVQLTDVSMITRPENNWYCYPLFSKRLCILAVIAPMGQIGNAIFILISGYFMAYKDAIDLTKISKKLLIQLGFAAVVLGLVSIYAYRNITEFSIALVPFSAFNEMSGFIGYYFTVIVIAKIFLNGILNRLTQKNYAMLLMTLFAFIQFAWSASILANLAQGLELLCTGLFLYLLGGYIKKYDPFESIRLWAVISIIIVTNLIVIGNFYISTASQILSFNPERGDMFIQQIPTYGNNHIVPIVLGIAVFELFKRIKIRRNYVVNFCGGGTLMAYLLHDNTFFYKLWNTQNWIALLHNNIIQFSTTYFVWVLKTFMVGLLGYCLLEVIVKLLCVCKPLVFRKLE